METFSREELNKIKLFQFVDLESIKGILDACTFRSLTAGEILITAGQQNRTVYFLLEGHVRVHLNSLQSEPTATLGPGDSVGEMSVIDHQPTSAFVVAAEPVRLLAMDEELLWSLVHSSHAAACNLLIGLSTRLRHADAAISESNEMEEDGRHYGTVDALTGLHNRYWMDMVLERQVQRSITGGLPLSLIIIDIDNFKSFNDRYGRAYGGARALFDGAYALGSPASDRDHRPLRRRRVCGHSARRGDRDGDEDRRASPPGGSWMRYPLRRTGVPFLTRRFPSAWRS